MSGSRWTEEQMAAHERKLRGAVPLPTKRPSKMRNVPVVVDGQRFDSQREAERWRDLLWLQASGAIIDLEHHRIFGIAVNGVWICDVEIDFSYREKFTGYKLVVEDVKPKFKTEAHEKRYKRTDAYRRFALKKRLMLAVFGIDVKEV